MGEMADYYLSLSWDDELEEEEDEIHTKRCRHCGVEGLVWIHTADGWRLGSEGFVHTCTSFKNSTKFNVEEV
jgi:hypothetical protein